MATEYSHVEFVQKFSFIINFSGWLRGVSVQSAVGRQSLIPELVRDVKILKMYFTAPYLCPSLRHFQPTDTDAVQHFPIPLYPPI